MRLPEGTLDKLYLTSSPFKQRRVPSPRYRICCFCCLFVAVFVVLSVFSVRR